MRFSRTRLLAAAEAALAAAKNRHAERVAAWDQFVARSRRDWLAEHGQEWQAFATTIETLLEAGEVIDHKTLPGQPSRWSEPYRDDEDRRRPDPHYADGPAELRALIEVLNVIEGDEVTTAGLHALGITGSTMAVVANHLARSATNSKAA